VLLRITSWLLHHLAQHHPPAPAFPLSGLDTFKAYKVVKILNVLAKNYGRTVVATIHQPSSEIFHLFDDLVLLADGQV
jgi:ABC-type multidrug transport system ATPase subunit